MTLVRPARPSGQGLLLRSQPQPALSAEAPFNVAAVAHEAGDVLPDAVVEHGLPRHEAEAEPAVAAQGFEHGEPAAGELSGADELAGNVSAGNSGPPWQTALCGERFARSFDVGRLQPLDQ